MGAVETDGGDAMAGNDTGNDIHPAPALLLKPFERRVDAPPGDNLRVAVAEIGVGFVQQLDALLHRHQAGGLLQVQYQGGVLCHVALPSGPQ